MAHPWCFFWLLLLHCSVALFVAEGNHSTSSSSSVSSTSCPNCFSEFAQSKRHWKRYAEDATFRGNPKTREEVWHQNFNTASSLFDQTPSLILLLNKIIATYMGDCVPVVLYDS